MCNISKDLISGLICTCLKILLHEIACNFVTQVLAQLIFALPNFYFNMTLSVVYNNNSVFSNCKVQTVSIPENI